MTVYIFEKKIKYESMIITILDYIIFVGLFILTFGFYHYDDSYKYEFTNGHLLSATLDTIFENINLAIEKNLESRSFISNYIDSCKLHNKGFRIIVTNNKYDKFIEIIRNNRVKRSRTFYNKY